MMKTISLSDEILILLAEKHKNSGGRCGTYGVELQKLSGKNWQEIREALKPLYTEKKIEVRDGSQGKLFFLKTDKRKIKR